MDFPFDGKGTMYGATSVALYSIDLKTGTGHAGGRFRRRQRHHGPGFESPVSDLYLVDPQSGCLTPVANSHNLVLASQ